MDVHAVCMVYALLEITKRDLSNHSRRVLTDNSKLLIVNCN